MPKEPSEQITARTQVRKPSNRLSKVLGLFIIVLGGLAFYFYLQYSDLKADPSADAAAETAKLTEQVGKLIVLPEGEQPTVATVTDVEKLKDQPFFAKAQNGYKVLIYTEAKKAILFDPIANKIIEVAPINIGDSTKTKQTPATTPAPVIPAPATSTNINTGSTTTP